MFNAFSLNLGGRLVDFTRPAVMAIINATDDSFYSGSRAADAADVAARAARAIAEGADMIDLGAFSTRPGAADVAEPQERTRIVEAVKAVRSVSGDIPVSIDTFRASVAEAALEAGADIVNDISAGLADPEMVPLVARRGVPYIIMHMRGTPQTMQTLTDYDADGGVTAGVISALARRVEEISRAGVKQLILDPGFGFAKTVEQNWQLLKDLSLFGEVFSGRPVLAGLSRKSMLYKPLGLTPEDVLPATCMANTLALLGGAAILRVHDVAAAAQLCGLYRGFEAC